jgi:tripartite-type tricarboxylate transporter receptor subunit TctC
MAQAGLEGFVVESWYGLMAPKELAPSTISLLERRTAQALLDPKVLEVFNKNGAEVRSSTGNELAALVLEERARWADVIRRANVKIRCSRHDVVLQTLLQQLP